MSLVFCDSCFDQIPAGSIVVRIGSGKSYHQDCFVCSHCKAKLRDNLYVQHLNNPLCKKCGDHICKGCSQVIDSIFVTLPDNTKYHPACVKCSMCSRQLKETSNNNSNSSSNRISLIDSKPYCQSCYNSETNKPQCSKCHRSILSTLWVDALNKKWHPECLTCTRCNASVVEKTFAVRNNGDEIYCESCNDFICIGCKNPIAINEAFVSYQEKKYHQRCFQCSSPNCNNVLDYKAFQVVNGQPVCYSHYQQSARIQ